MDVASALGGLPGVDKVERNALQRNRFTVFPSQGQAIYATVNEQVQNNGWPVRALYTERGRLDDVFRQITQQPIAPQQGTHQQSGAAAQ